MLKRSAPLAFAVAFAALSIFGTTAAQAQNATSRCLGGFDPNARACLFIFELDGSQCKL